MDNNDKRSRIAFRLLRIALIAVVLFLVMVVLRPERFLPPDMTLGEFFHALFGVVIWAGVFAAASFRAWNDYQNKRRNKK